MKKQFMAITLAAVLLASNTVMAEEPAKFNDRYPALYASVGLTPDYAAPITRAEFSMLAFDAFRTINGGMFPQMEAKNVFTDIGDRSEDIFTVMLCGLGVVNGVSNTEFAPRTSLRRQELCVILTRAKLRQNPDSMADIAAADGALSDISDGSAVADWAKQGVEYAYKTGFFTLKDGAIAPNDAVTVQEAMDICAAFCGQ